MEETFYVGTKPYKMFIYPGPNPTERYPVVMVLHGIFGLNPPYGPQIHDFAQHIAAQGYVSAVPDYTPGVSLESVIATAMSDPNKAKNPTPHLEKLEAAIAKATGLGIAKPGELGLIGYSLGGALAMLYLARHPGTAKVFVDFFGPADGHDDIMAAAPGFPPTIIFHDNADPLVDVTVSQALHAALGDSTKHKIHLYDEPKHSWPDGGNHAFNPGGDADRESRKLATEWIVKHLPPN